MTKQAKKDSGKDPNDMSHSEFIEWFMNHHKAAITRNARRRLIPNRYSVDDIKSYIVDCILSTLERRVKKKNPIKEPKIYFRKLIDYYCIEFQRMHGYIFSMPKRPRDQEAENEICSYGFLYLDKTLQEDNVDILGYVEDNEYSSELKGGNYLVKGIDPGNDTPAWNNIMKMALPEDQYVLKCIFKHNMSVVETSKHLNIAICTTYQRKDRGIRAISGTLASFVDLDNETWKVFKDVSGLREEDIDITQYYVNR